MDGFCPSRLNKDGIRIHAPEDFAGMRGAGRRGRRTSSTGSRRWSSPGVTTAELDAAVEAMIDQAGAVSATIGYKGYRHATCISVNHVVCHGIPSEKRLRAGDILNIDVTVVVDGWYGEFSRMYVAGPPSRKAERLIQITHDALMEGIAQVRPGNTFGDIGAAIQRLAERSAARWCATSAATGSGGCSTRRRTCCTTGARAPGRCSSRGCSSPSSR